MFKFFTDKNWFKWSIFGTIFILIATASIVYIDVQINKWFGEFTEKDFMKSTIPQQS